MEFYALVHTIPSIGPQYAKKLQRLNIRTVRDLIYHLPQRYQNFALISNITNLQHGEIATIQGQILSIKNIYARGGKKIQTAEISDGESTIEATWFNQPYLVKALPQGTYISLSGKIKQFGRKKTIVSPQYEKITNYESGITNIGTIHTGRLVPIYPETSGVSSKWLRSRISKILPHSLSSIEETLPENIREKNGLMDLKTALEKIHFPLKQTEAEMAKDRLAFEELFEMQLLALSRKKEWKKNKLAHKLSVNQEKVLEFINNLPFALTESQKTAVREILQDLSKEQPMNRLLEGDVGSGKTVVAAIGCFAAYLNGFQSAIMAPTQILAQQHYDTLSKLLSPLGVKVNLVTGGKKTIRNQGKTKGEYCHSSSIIHHSHTNDVLVGTQALIQKNIAFDQLALVIVDEQHRFGVAQRALLAKKGGEKIPHVLTMTATPIPRTIVLTMYGDLDLSTLDQMPKGRVQIKTWVVPHQKRESAYEWIKKRVQDTDEQAFIVCPLIEESEKETMQSIKAASAEFKKLSTKIFTNLRLGLLHGKMKPKEKNEVMEKFKMGEIDILVATPVVEVGIDIPNATIMLIEASERFGLSQLHQLRGRVGRGSKQSYCLLFSDSRSEISLSRLKALERTLSGAQLAELDLKLRGPGEVYGTRQHGFPELKIASFSDYDLIKRARQAAEEVVDKLNLYPKLQNLISQKQSIAPN